jgi:hypothetical protein
MLDADSTFFKGAKSDTDPGQLPVGYYFSGLNVINQGGMISCRPGHRCVITFPAGNLQGGAIFRPKIGLEKLVVMVDGRVFAAEFPFTEFKQLENLQFSAHAKQAFFELAEQSARRITDNDIGSAVETINPRSVLMIQDGGSTAPGYYDGTENGHIRNNAFETPAGSVMKWVGDRLWVATPGGFLRASDIANPFSFREEIYLGGVSAFTFTGEITAMEATPGLELPQLLVWTNENCSLIKASIRQRDQWEQEPDMQRQIFAVGATSARSVTLHYGQLMWYSQEGLVMFDSAVLSQKSARLPARDSELHISKTQLHGDTSLVAGGAFSQYLLMSVPASDIYNAHTWVLNDASIETLNESTAPSWCGVWTGTRPIQWIRGNIAGKERIYHLSKDHDGENRLWESFMPDRLDNGCPIMWAAELRGYFGAGGPAGKALGQDCRFRYAEVALVGIEETLDFGIYFAGSLRGAYKQISAKQVSISRGCLDAAQEITADSILYAHKAQTRRIRSEDVNDKPLTQTGSCPVERPDSENVDESFQVLLVGHGPAAVRWVRVFADPEKEEETGGNCKDEEPVNAIRFDGVGVKGADLTEVAEALDVAPLQFTANKTVSMEYRGGLGTGVGFAESLVSEKAADRVATRIAERMAENEIMRQLPKTYSAGVEE